MALSCCNVKVSGRVYHCRNKYTLLTINNMHICQVIGMMVFIETKQFIIAFGGCDLVIVLCVHSCSACVVVLSIV